MDPVSVCTAWWASSLHITTQRVTGVPVLWKAQHGSKLLGHSVTWTHQSLSNCYVLTLYLLRKALGHRPELCLCGILPGTLCPILGFSTHNRLISLYHSAAGTTAGDRAPSFVQSCFFCISDTSSQATQPQPSDCAPRPANLFIS